MTEKDKHYQLYNNSLDLPLSRMDIFMIYSIYFSRIIEEAIIEDNILAGKGIVFYMFIIFFFYTVVKNFHILNRIINNKIFISASLFTLASFLIESFHPNSSYREAGRNFFMTLSIPLFAVWTYRNIKAANHIIYSFIVYSLILALNIVLNVTLPEMLAVGDADLARGLLSDKTFFVANANGVAYCAGVCFLLCLTIDIYVKPSRIWKLILYLLMVIFFYTLILCISRSAYINFAFISIVISVAFKIKPKRKHYFALSILLVVYILGVADNVGKFLFSRFDTITLNEGEAQDSRAILYSTQLRYLGEVAFIGVGEANYYGSWGENTDLAKTGYDEEGGFYSKVLPAHSSISQILFYWGFIPLVLYLFINWYSFRFLAPTSLGFYSTLCYILIYSVPIYFILLTNNFNNKDLSMIYGLIIGVTLNSQKTVKKLPAK